MDSKKDILLVFRGFTRPSALMHTVGALCQYIHCLQSAIGGYQSEKYQIKNKEIASIISLFTIRLGFSTSKL